MRQERIIVTGLLVLSATGLAQSPPEYQIRLLGHTQLVPSGARWGAASWLVFPNLSRTSPLRSLVLVGVVHKGDRRWTEFLAGEMLNSAEPPGFELDVRHLERGVSWLTAFIEAEYNFRSRKLFIMPAATLPLPVAHLRAGVESDLVFTRNGNAIVLGPRLVAPIPICFGVCRDLSLTTAFRHQAGHRDVVRQYIALTF